MAERANAISCTTCSIKLALKYGKANKMKVDCPTSREPRSLHQFEQRTPFLARIWSLTQLIKVSQLKNFFVDEFERNSACIIGFTEPDAYACGVAINIPHHFNLMVLLVQIYRKSVVSIRSTGNCTVVGSDLLDRCKRHPPRYGAPDPHNAAPSMPGTG